MHCGRDTGTCATNATGRFYWWLSGSVFAESDLSANFTAAYPLIRGQIAARIDLPSNTIHYYFHDHLGSTDVVTDALGNVQNESDYYPYGGEIPILSGDTNRYKFNGKERDSESGLDNFGARFDTSAMGRFMTPDWAAKPTTVPYANFGNPQSLNLYSYVENNPTTLGDPDGHQYAEDTDDDTERSSEQSDRETWREGELAGREEVQKFDAQEKFDNSPARTLVNGDDPVTGICYTKPPTNGTLEADRAESGQTPDNENRNYKDSPENDARMAQGKAPIGKDGHPVELHHEDQSATGGVKEMTRTDHRLGENFAKNHPNTGQESSQIDRDKFKQQRQEYWKNKVKKPNEN